MKNLKCLLHYLRQSTIWLKYNGFIFFALPIYIVVAILLNKGILPNYPDTNLKTLMMFLIVFSPVFGFFLSLYNHWKYNGWQKCKC